jgi:hypothetical protein
MIFLQLNQQLQSLSNLLTALSNEQYIHRIEHLGNASIGGHTRHIIELLQCALDGYQTGTVDYVNRKRDLRLQEDKKFAQNIIEAILVNVKNPDKKLEMLVEEIEDAISDTVTTTFFREIVYNTEHTIHHLALIKVALIEMQLNLVGQDFGMAYSTLKFKAALINA